MYEFHYDRKYESKIKPKYGSKVKLCYMDYGLLNTWPYMSHLKSKIKRSIFQKNQESKRGRRGQRVV